MAGIQPPDVQAPVSLSRGHAAGTAGGDHRGKHEDAHRVHLTARRGGEIYLEFFRFPYLQPPEEYARHREYLAGRFGPEAVSELTKTNLRGWPAWSYAFRGNGIERAVLAFQVGEDTYRIISDPRARLNDEIIATVSIEE